LLRLYYAAKNSGDRLSELRALAQLRQHSRDEIALLERAGALEQLAPPTWDKVEAPIPSAPPSLPTTTDPATAAREAATLSGHHPDGAVDPKPP
jgi:hypothetical protein